MRLWPYFLFLIEFLCSLPLLAMTFSTLSRGKSNLHRLNKPLAYRNMSSLKKASVPVFNYGGSTFIGREHELGNGTGEENGSGSGSELGGVGERDSLLDLQRQMLTTLPDLSDPCFRRYANSIIVNAQPYERRSSISLIHCKVQCLRSQLGLYSCRSFVYDNVNQVCDLFAHVGDQAPARLLRFQTRDYFEPTAAIHCVPPPSVPAAPSAPAASSSSSSEDAGSSQFAPAMGVQQQNQMPPAVHQQPSNPIPTLGPIVWPTVAAASAATAAAASMMSTATITAAASSPPTKVEPAIDEEEEGDQPEESESATGLTLLKPAEAGAAGEGDEEEESAEEEQQRLEGARQHNSENGNGQQRSCLPGQVPRFLRTKDFELFGQDQHRMAGMSEQRCLDLCVQQGNSSSSSTMPIQCNSLEFTASIGECVFSTETAVPVGNGQLRQRQGTDYLERVCVDERLANECRTHIYRRFPQMILVGFAETVVDSISLQQCLDNCLNSRQLYGFRCSSGMFYFEEPQLNCILNTEDRESQPDLFTTETSDLVDYFEIGCGKRRLSSPNNQPAQLSTNGKDYEEETNELRKRDFVERSAAITGGQQARQHQRLGWTPWTVCIARSQWTALGSQARWRVCVGGRMCGKEERQCILAKSDRKASGHSDNHSAGRPPASTSAGNGGTVPPSASISRQRQQQQTKPSSPAQPLPQRRDQRRVAAPAPAAIGTVTAQHKVAAGTIAAAGKSPPANGTNPNGRKSILPPPQRKVGGGGSIVVTSSPGQQQPRRCRSEECCPLLGSCRLGIRFGPQGRGANWCKNPCG